MVAAYGRFSNLPVSFSAGLADLYVAATHHTASNELRFWPIN
nr:hypothetical protein [Pseudomonas putida]